jgi:uncharacterized protein (DUF169 family)
MDKIGIKITKEKPEGIKRIGRKQSHCGMVAKARCGDVFYAEAGDYSCSLARFNLGLQQRNERFMESLKEHFVKWKHAENVDMAAKYLGCAKCLPVENKYIIYFPLNCVNSGIKPDVVVCIGNPKEIMDLIHGIVQKTGERLDVTVSGVSATCSESTAIPLITGKPNVSLGCCGTRAAGTLGDDELLAGLPEKYFKFIEAE